MSNAVLIYIFERKKMVEDNMSSTLRSNSIRDKRPHQYLARGRIWNVLKWKGKGKILMLEVTSPDLDETIFHFTCPQALVNSALNCELFATMKDGTSQMIIQVGDMGEEYEREAMEDLYFNMLTKKVVEENENKHRLTMTRYGNGTRVVIDDEDDCRAIFFTSINDEYEEDEREGISFHFQQ